MNNETENGITIQTMSCDCDYSSEVLDELCPDCQDQKETRGAEIAYQIVDEGNLQYKHIWSQTELDVSGHDWIGSVTKLQRPAIQIDGSVVEERYEFLDAISVITDRLFDLETSLTVTANETVCQDCHYLHNSAIACPNCN